MVLGLHVSLSSRPSSPKLECRPGLSDGTQSIMVPSSPADASTSPATLVSTYRRDDVRDASWPSQTSWTPSYDVYCLRVLHQSGEICDISVFSTAINFPELSSRQLAINCEKCCIPDTHPNIVITARRSEPPFAMEFKVCRIYRRVIIMPCYEKRGCLHLGSAGSRPGK